MSIKIALAGNPNCGKTTLFNALTGSNQYVGNWPGVTVEKKEGKLKKHNDVVITDLPGIYSLSPYTLEEVVARNYLIDEKPDVVLNIIDGTNLERNLYLTTQVVELGIPVVVAVNMMDIVKKNGDKINIKELSRQLACPVVEISALKGTGVMEAAVKAVEAVDTCVGKVVDKILSKGGAAIITADHGNAEYMWDANTESTVTAHSTNPVPFMVVGEELKDAKLKEDGRLSDIAPTILDMMNLEKPEQMTGHSLIK